MKAKEFIPTTKPRNFVAKNQKTAGAGQHKDKKRAEKQGDVKHKAKQFEEGAIIAKDDLVDIYIKGTGKNNMPIQKKVGAQIPNSKVNSFIAKVAEKYGLNPNAFVYGPSQTAEGWKSKVAGAALAGAAALGAGGAQASDSVGPLAVMATIKMQLPDGSTKTIKKDLGHSYDYKLDDARKDLEKLLDQKGIKKYTIHLDRYDSGSEKVASQEKPDYIQKTPAVGKSGDKTDYMDKSPLTAKPSKATYLDKSTGKEFRDMDNY